MKDNSVFRRLARVAQMDQECQDSVTLVEISGCKRVLIERHCGVCSYDIHCVRIRGKEGFLLVEGDRLLLAHLKKDLLVVEGIIHCVRLEGGGAR